MKLVVEAGTQIVRGVHMMGLIVPRLCRVGNRGENGGKKADFDAVIGIHHSRRRICYHENKTK